MSTDKYYSKYLKYKQKYFNLKNNIELKGGAPPPPPPLPISLGCNTNTGQCYHDPNGKLYPSIYNCNTHCQQRSTDLTVSNVSSVPRYNPIYNLSNDIYTPIYYDRPVRRVEYYDDEESNYDSDSEYEYVVTRKKKSKKRKTKKKISKKRKSSKKK